MSDVASRWTPMQIAVERPASRTRPAFLDALLLVPVLIGLWATSRYSYTLFHSLAELLAVAVALGVFLIAWSARDLVPSPYLLFLGMAFPAIAAVDVLHMLAYKVMGVFAGHDADLPTQLWIAGRYLQTGALVAAPFAIGRRPRPGWWLGGFAAAATALVILIFAGLFPQCFVEGTGLTAFKVGSEYVLSALLVASVTLLLHRRDAFDARVLRLLALSAVLVAASELTFTFYSNVYGPSNLAGHLLRIVAFYLLYKAVIDTGLRHPLRVLFRDLSAREGELLRVREELEEHVRDRTAELARLNAELERRVAERTAELTSVNRELEAFAYSVSHDLRAPLRHIDGFGNLLLENCESVLDERGRHYLARISAGTERMNRLIDDVLALSRITQHSLALGPIDVTGLARSVAEELRRAEPGRKVEVEVAEGLVAEGDRHLVRVLLENLLGNAWKYTAPRERAHVEVGSAEIEGKQVFFVRDDGVGFDPEYAGKLFAPFQRLHGESEFPGTGIGLASVRRIVERHGGRVWAESTPGEGAVFSFTLERGAARSPGRADRAIQL